MPRHIRAEVIERHTFIRRPFWLFNTIQKRSFDIFRIVARCSAFLRSVYQSLQRHINVYRPASSPSAELEDLAASFVPMALRSFTNQFAEIVQPLLTKAGRPFVLARSSCAVVLCIRVPPQGCFGPLRRRGQRRIWVSQPAVGSIPAWDNDITAICLCINAECDYIYGVLKPTARCISVDMIASRRCRHARCNKLLRLAALQPFKLAYSVFVMLHIQINYQYACI